VEGVALVLWRMEVGGGRMEGGFIMIALGVRRR